jgi:hypothetical protein
MKHSPAWENNTVVPQLVKKYPAFFGTRRFLQFSQDPATCPYPERDEPSPSPPIPFHRLQFNITPHPFSSLRQDFWSGFLTGSFSYIKRTLPRSLIFMNYTNDWGSKFLRRWKSSSPPQWEQKYNIYFSSTVFLDSSIFNASNSCLWFGARKLFPEHKRAISICL